MPRLGYKKSRKGCERCRQRRVKCDEQKPCRACVRHGVRCSLTQQSSRSSRNTPELQIEDTPPIRTQTKPSTAALYPSLDTVCADLLDTINSALSKEHVELSREPVSRFEEQYPELDPEVDGPQEEDSNWDMRMELMHNYTLHTCFTLPRGADGTDYAWQTEVPKLAFAYKHLLHQLLTFSAFHLAYLHPERRQQYLIAAWQHQRESSQLFRATLDSVLEEEANQSACFITSLLTASTTFARLSINASEEEGSNIESHSSIVDIAGLFVLIRGLVHVARRVENTVKKGPVGVILALSNVHGPDEPWTEMISQLRELSIFIRKEAANKVAAVIADLEIYKLIDAIKAALLASPLPEHRLVVTWPRSMSDDFIRLLRERNSIALVLVAYYCVIVHEMETHKAHKTWYVRGLGTKWVADIEAETSAEWREMLRWPITRIRNHPSAG